MPRPRASRSSRCRPPRREPRRWAARTACRRRRRSAVLESGRTGRRRARSSPPRTSRASRASSTTSSRSPAACGVAGWAPQCAMASQPIDGARRTRQPSVGSGSHDLEFRAAYGRRARLRARASASAVRERIASEAATTWSGSVGATWDPEHCAALARRDGRAARRPRGELRDRRQRGGDMALPMAVQSGVRGTARQGHGLDCTLALSTRVSRAVVGKIPLPAASCVTTAWRCVSAGASTTTSRT